MLDRVQRLPMSEWGKRAQSGKILELHRGILREPFLQVYGKALRRGRPPRERQRECRGILHIAPFCEVERRHLRKRRQRFVESEDGSVGRRRQEGGFIQIHFGRCSAAPPRTAPAIRRWSRRPCGGRPHELTR